MGQYSIQEIKQFELKDLRITRIAMCKSLIEKLDNVNEVQNVCELADEYVSYIYKGLEKSGTKPEVKPIDWTTVVPVLNEAEIKILDLLWIEYEKKCPNGMETEKMISRHKLCSLIVEIFGKYPTNRNSISKVMDVVKLEQILT